MDSALTNELLQVITWLIGVVIALISWIGIRALKRLDDIDNTIHTNIPKLCVDVADLKARVNILEKSK